VTFGAAGVTVGASTVTIGTSTRATVEAGLGVGQADGGNDFRVAYCGQGILVQYVDNDGTLSTSPAAAGTDVVARVLTLDGAAANGFGATIGQAPPERAATTTATLDGGGELRFFAEDGGSIVVADGVVTQITAFKAQPGNVWTLPLTLENDSQSLSTLTRGRTFADAAAVLGGAHDAQGVVSVPVLGNTLVRIWAAAGVRIAGRCSSNCANPNATQIDSITLSPPYFGRDGGVGIGSTRAALEADIGTGAGPDENGLVVYGDPSVSDFLLRRGDTALGVAYAQDSDCVERVVGLVFNYVAP
jgi:hypothetical protein